MKTFLTTIKIFIFIIAVFFIQLDCVANTGNLHFASQLKQPFMTGLDVLLENDCLYLKGKKVGLITNQTVVTSKMVQNIDAFRFHFQNDFDVHANVWKEFSWRIFFMLNSMFESKPSQTQPVC